MDEGRPLHRARPGAWRGDGGAPPAVPVAARVCVRVRRRVALRETSRACASRREHVSLAGRSPRDAGLPPALGPGGSAVRPRHPRPLAHGDSRVRRDGDGAGARPSSVTHPPADGSGSARDEHLVPGRGTQPCGEMLEHLADAGWEGSIILEVSTRRLSAEERELDLAAGLAFARLYHAPTGGAGMP